MELAAKNGEPLFIGSHVALDFLNTEFSPAGETVETIGDGASFLAWLTRAELLTESDASRLKRRLSAEAMESVAAEARTLRAWATTWISRWSHAPNEDYNAELRRLNGVLNKASGHHREVVSANGRLQLLERDRLESGDDILALLATQIAILITSEDPTLVRRCAGPGCTLLFVDRTKGHRRLFCSAAACGNRAKVAAFRARQKKIK